MRGPFITKEDYRTPSPRQGYFAGTVSVDVYKVRLEDITSEGYEKLEELDYLTWDFSSHRPFSDCVVFTIQGPDMNEFIDKIIEYKLGEPHILLGLMLDRATV